MPASPVRTALTTLVSNLLGTPAPHPRLLERRASPRHQAALTAEVVSGERVYQARIRTISAGGLTLAFSTMPTLFKGAQLLVHAPGFAPITGSVCWTSATECGLAFNVALAKDLLDDASILFDPGKRARPGRARVKLAAIARAPGLERKVTIDNIGSGGAQISSGLQFPLAIGRGIMLEVEGVLLIGGYVRWAKQGRYGLMFSKLLPLAAAEDIAERCSIHPSWLSEVKAAHVALVSGAQ